MKNAKGSVQLGISVFHLREFSISIPIQNTKYAKGYMKLRKLILIAIPHPFSSLKRVCCSNITQFLMDQFLNTMLWKINLSRSFQSFFFLISNQNIMYRLMCWLPGSLNCRIPNVMRSPPAWRSLVSSITVDFWLLVDEVSTLSLNLLTTQTMVTTGILPTQRKFPWWSRESNTGPRDQQSEAPTTRPRGWSGVGYKAIIMYIYIYIC